MDQASLEYCWTKSPTNEDDIAPGLGWRYYGSYIRGDVTSGLWRLTRWARESGETSLFIAEKGGYPKVYPSWENLPKRTPAEILGFVQESKRSDTVTEVSDRNLLRNTDRNVTPVTPQPPGR